MSAILATHVDAECDAEACIRVIQLLASRGVCFKYSLYSAKTLLATHVQEAADAGVPVEVIDAFAETMVCVASYDLEIIF